MHTYQVNAIIAEIFNSLLCLTTVNRLSLFCLESSLGASSDFVSDVISFSDSKSGKTSSNLTLLILAILFTSILACFVRLFAISHLRDSCNILEWKCVREVWKVYSESLNRRAKKDKTDKQWSAKHNTENFRLSKTSLLKNLGWTPVTGKVSGSCSTHNIHRVTFVVSHEWGKKGGIIVKTNWTYLQSSVTQIFPNGQPTHDCDHCIFDWLSDLYLTPTLAIFQLYRGASEFYY